uniref:Glycosyltransferase n=1 Tax=Bradyrhizobium japonicum TaxID=375 RepID=Q9RHC2_BRAJP|nr:unknown [Bradyrhizobium japonicum]
MSGPLRVFLILCAGPIGSASYRVNDYGYVAQHPEEVACIIGRTFLLDKFAWKNPILLGVAAHNHPLDDPDLFKRLPVKKVVVPGQWYADMYRAVAGPTRRPGPSASTRISGAVARLAEDRRRADLRQGPLGRERYAPELIEPVRARLLKEGRSFTELRYGSYKEEDYQAALAPRADDLPVPERKPGHRYQQALACGVPVFAWDPGGPWRDPDYYPHRVKFEPVSSVPYWDHRCGTRFVDSAGFEAGWDDFWAGCAADAFDPRGFVLDNLTLEQQRCNITRSRERGAAAEGVRRVRPAG